MNLITKYYHGEPKRQLATNKTQVIIPLENGEVKLSMTYGTPWHGEPIRCITVTVTTSLNGINHTDIQSNLLNEEGDLLLPELNKYVIAMPNDIVVTGYGIYKLTSFASLIRISKFVPLTADGQLHNIKVIDGFVITLDKVINVYNTNDIPISSSTYEFVFEIPDMFDDKAVITSDPVRIGDNIRISIYGFCGTDKISEFDIPVKTKVTNRYK